METEERPRRLLARFGALLVTTALIAAVIATVTAITHAGRPAPAAQPSLLGTPLTINTKITGIYCPTQAFLSPDGSQIAVVGARQPCADTDSATALVPHLLALYDRTTGYPVHVYRLDSLIGVDDSAHGQNQVTRAARYYALGWAPDGNRFALAYAAFDSAHSLLPDDLLASGLLIVHTRDAASHATIIPGDAGFFAASTSSYAGLPVWNLDTSSVSPPITSGAALAYAWGPHGLPEPLLPLSKATTSLPLTAGARYPAGNPDGDSTYTVWQAGVLLGPQANRSVPALQPNQDALLTIFPAWSPHGATATLMVSGLALPLPQAVPPGGSDIAPGGPLLPAPATLPQVPARDAALRAVQGEISTGGWALVAWNPQGTILASSVCSAGPGTSAGSQSLQLRRSDTGVSAGTAQIPLSAGEQACAATASGENLGDYPSLPQWLTWSSDGSSLLLTDQQAARVTVWGVAAQGLAQGQE